MKEKTLKTLEYDKIIDLLIDMAESDLGKNKIKRIRPSKDKKKIEGWLEETEEALKLLIRRGRPPLYGIKSIREEISRVNIGGSLAPEGLLKIADTLRVSQALKNYLEEDDMDKESEYPVIERYIEELAVYPHIERRINQAIISEEEISDDASPKLKSIRREILNKNDAIRNRLDSMVNSKNMEKHLQDNIVTMRDGRYVIPVKQESKRFVDGIVHDTSGSGATAFIEPIAVVELNNELRQLEIDEEKEIERILAELSNLVAEHSGMIGGNEYRLMNLDFIFAKGKLAMEMDATKPILNDLGYINLKKARHPLLDKETVVPIDIYIGDEFKSLVITGPNTGGKTVTLKTVGLCTLMAQTGLHIPAGQNSDLGVFDRVFADIGDEQSIEQNLSTFSSHMTNIVNILENVEDNSLILFDELGAGTDPTEGAALAMSILDYLLQKDVRTIATTHYSQLKLYALTTEGVSNASVEFDVETLQPTYKLSIGVPGKSNAFEISKRLGLEDFIIDYARELISKENLEFEDVLQAIEEDRKEAEEKRYETERLNLEIKELKEELAKEEEKTVRMRDDILSKAKIEARDILRNAKRESDEIVRELREISKEAGQYGSKKMHEARHRLSKSVSEAEREVSEDVLNVKSDEIPDDLKVGDTVEVLSLNQTGEVLSTPDEDGNVNVQIGIMKVNVKIDTLRKTRSETEKKAISRSEKYISNKSRQVKPEIDLRGNNIEEAIVELDKYIDDVYISGLNEVTVIHGKGTGALREGLQSYFRTHRLIESFRPGEYGEGGTGVTVLNIK